jgi:hypothetical protein
MGTLAAEDITKCLHVRKSDKRSAKRPNAPCAPVLTQNKTVSSRLRAVSRRGIGIRYAAIGGI